MPAKPAYAHRLADAIANLERSSVTQVGRAGLEEILGVSKATAWRVLKNCGATPGPGGAFAVDRLQLIQKLKALAAGDVIAGEVARHNRVQDHLEQMREFVRSRAIEVVPVEHGKVVRQSSFANLPANIQLTARSCRIDYNSSQEFFEGLAAIGFAVQRDLDEIQELIDG